MQVCRGDGGFELGSRLCGFAPLLGLGAKSVIYRTGPTVRPAILHAAPKSYAGTSRSGHKQRSSRREHLRHRLIQVSCRGERVGTEPDGSPLNQTRPT